VTRLQVRSNVDRHWRVVGDIDHVDIAEGGAGCHLDYLQVREVR
jgi:hypothetical protein